MIFSVLRIKESQYLRLLVYFISFVWFLKFSGSVLSLHLLKSGLSFPELAIGSTLSVLAQILGVFILSRLRVENKLVWIISTILYFIVFSIYVFFPFSSAYFIGAFLSGLASVIFYGVYNVSHFETVARNKTGSGAAMFFNVLTAVGIFSPIIAGTVASLSLKILLFLSLIFALLSLYLIRLPQKKEISFSLRESLKEIKKVRIFIFLRGIHEAIHWGFIPLITISIIKDFFDLGMYSTLMALLGIAISHYLGKKSDSMKSKVGVLIPLALINGLLTLLFIFDFFQLNIIWWAVLNLIFGQWDGLFDQTALSFVMDETKDRIKATFGREVVLNIGRLFGMILVVIGFMMPNLTDYMIILLALSMFVYSFVLSKRFSNKKGELISNINNPIEVV